MDVPGAMFHEGAPGHHLQPGTAALNTTTLDRFQRLACEMRPGPCEGRGLYAERLTDELGYFADPAHPPGALATGHLLRAARIDLDIGLQLTRGPGRLITASGHSDLTPDTWELVRNELRHA
ncbi:DUF885 family protein [Streptomyces albidoflavus]